MLQVFVKVFVKKVFVLNSFHRIEPPAKLCVINYSQEHFADLIFGVLHPYKNNEDFRFRIDQ